MSYVVVGTVLIAGLGLMFYNIWLIRAEGFVDRGAGIPKIFSRFINE